MPPIEHLRQMQSLPMELKLNMTRERIDAWYRGWTKYTIENLKTKKIRYVTTRTIDINKDLEKELGCDNDEWVKTYEDGQVYIAFSGGKDSAVLLHIARRMFPDIKAVFVDTGLEYPEIRNFVKTFKNVEIIRPKMRFDEVIKKYGYPLISKEVGECVYQARKFIENKCGGVNTSTDWKKYLAKESMKNRTPGGEIASIEKSPDLANLPLRVARCLGMITKDNKIAVNIPKKDKSRYSLKKYEPLLYVDFEVSNVCCNIMKKQPSHSFSKKTGLKPMTAQMADESRLRTQQWIMNGCNGFEMKSPISNPLSFWYDTDILEYAKKYNVELAEPYGDIIPNSLQENMFGDIEYTTSGCKRTGCIFCGFGCHLEKESRWLELKRTHPKQYDYCIGGGEYNENGIWQPNKTGLGLGHCFDVINEIYGNDFIIYK